MWPSVMREFLGIRIKIFSCDPRWQAKQSQEKLSSSDVSNIKSRGESAIKNEQNNFFVCLLSFLSIIRFFCSLQNRTIWTENIFLHYLTRALLWGKCSWFDRFETDNCKFTIFLPLSLSHSSACFWMSHSKWCFDKCCAKFFFSFLLKMQQPLAALDAIWEKRSSLMLATLWIL